MDTPLKESIQSALRWMLAIYLVSFLLVFSAFYYIRSNEYAKMSELLTKNSRNSILIRDLRQAMSSLDPSTQESLISVSFYGADGGEVFSLKNPHIRSVWQQTHTLKLTSGSTEGSSDFGLIRYEYAMDHIILPPLLIWLMLLTLAWPIFRRVRKLLEMRHQEALAVREQKVLAEIAGQVSHDIRSPLSAIQIATAKLALNESQEAEILRASAKRIHDIATDLLDRARPSNLLPIPLKTATIPARILQELHREKAILFHARPSISLTLSISEEAEAVAVSIEEKNLARVVSNILNNSYEAISGEGTISMFLRSTSDTLSIHIIDTGKGISDQVLSQIGLRPVSLKQDALTIGNGLGLFHAKRIIEDAGGQLSVVSKLGRGTQVTITLPLNLSFPS